MKHFARSSLIVAFFFGLDKILALVRQTILQRQFGLSYELDVFNAANNIPDLLSALISGGALGVALIPVLSEYLETKGNKEAWKLFSYVLNLAFIVTLIIAVVVAIFAPVLISSLIAPGFPQEQKDLAVEIMRLDLLAIIIFSISGLVMAGLQTHQHFLFPAIAPALYNIGQIFGAVILAPTVGYTIAGVTLPAFGMGIHGLVYGVIIGSALHLLIQVPGLIHFKFHWAPGLGLRASGMNKVMALLGPRVATKFFVFVFFIMRDNLASGMGEGAVTALNMGWFIMQVPETLLGTTLAITLLPTISEIFARKDYNGFAETMRKAYRIMSALVIPAALLLAAGIKPLIATVFGYTPAEVELVSLATYIYLAGIFGHAMLEISVRAFYARQDALTPLAASALNASIYVGLAVLLSRWLGFSGIAIANSIAFTIEALLLMTLLRSHHSNVLKFGDTLRRVLLVSALSAGAVYGVLQINALQGLSNLIYAAIAAGAMLIGLGIVVPFIWPELKILLSMDSQPETLLD